MIHVTLESLVSEVAIIKSDTLNGVYICREVSDGKE